MEANERKKKRKNNLLNSLVRDFPAVVSHESNRKKLLPILIGILFLLRGRRERRRNQRNALKFKSKALAALTVCIRVYQTASNLTSLSVIDCQTNPNYGQDLSDEYKSIWPQSIISPFK